MNKEDEIIYSPLPASDLKFMHDILHEYSIPQDVLFMLILDFRNTQRNPFSQTAVITQEDNNSKERERAFLLQSRVQEIIIRTEAGDFTLKRDDKHFIYFQQAFKAITSDYRKYLPRRQEDVLESLLDGDVFLLNSMLVQYPSLLTSHRYHVIGMFLVHFNVDKRVTIKTEDEWTSNPTSDQDYKHYLVKFVKSRLKSINKRFSM